MKVLFTADIHIRLGQKNIPKDWAINRYNIIWSEIERVYKEYNCEYEIHGGDIFDKIPSLEELNIYFKYISSTKGRPIIIFDGNHEATKKGHTFLHYLSSVIESVNEEALVLPGCWHTDWADFIPYTNIKEKGLDKYKQNKLLFTHVRGEIPPHVTPEIDLEELSHWDLVLAGDLHSHSNSQKNIVYPGSPSTVTFHRAEVDTGVIVVDTDTLEWEWVKIKVPQLIRKTIDNQDDMIKTEYNHTIYELTGDIIDLAKVDTDVELLDKKIVKYETEATLDLAGLTLEDELYIYLEDIMQLGKTDIDKILRVYNDNIAGIDLE